MSNFIFKVIWAGAMTWLINNPEDPRWQAVTNLVRDLGGIPD